MPSPKTLAGEWHQDITYFQAKGIINQLVELETFEDYELFFTTDRLAATRVVGKEPDQQRVYWESPWSFAKDSSGNYQITFNGHEGEPTTAIVYFEGRHLILNIGKRRVGFLRERASNLRIKKGMFRETRPRRRRTETKRTMTSRVEHNDATELGLCPARRLRAMEWREREGGREQQAEVDQAKV